jgi:hypothetical protein
MVEVVSWRKRETATEVKASPRLGPAVRRKGLEGKRGKGRGKAKRTLHQIQARPPRFALESVPVLVHLTQLSRLVHQDPQHNPVRRDRQLRERDELDRLCLSAQRYGSLPLERYERRVDELCEFGGREVSGRVGLDETGGGRVRSRAEFGEEGAELMLSLIDVLLRSIAVGAVLGGEVGVGGRGGRGGSEGGRET